MGCNLKSHYAISRYREMSEWSERNDHKRRLVVMTKQNKTDDCCEEPPTPSDNDKKDKNGQASGKSKRKK